MATGSLKRKEADVNFSSTNNEEIDSESGQIPHRYKEKEGEKKIL